MARDCEAERLIASIESSAQDAACVASGRPFEDCIREDMARRIRIQQSYVDCLNENYKNRDEVDCITARANAIEAATLSRLLCMSQATTAAERTICYQRYQDRYQQINDEADDCLDRQNDPNRRVGKQPTIVNPMPFKFPILPFIVGPIVSKFPTIEPIPVSETFPIPINPFRRAGFIGTFPTKVVPPAVPPSGGSIINGVFEGVGRGVFWIIIDYAIGGGAEKINQYLDDPIGWGPPDFPDRAILPVPISNRIIEGADNTIAGINPLLTPEYTGGGLGEQPHYPGPSIIPPSGPPPNPYTIPTTLDTIGGVVDNFLNEIWPSINRGYSSPPVPGRITTGVYNRRSQGE